MLPKGASSAIHSCSDASTGTAARLPRSDLIGFFKCHLLGCTVPRGAFGGKKLRDRARALLGERARRANM